MHYLCMERRVEKTKKHFRVYVDKDRYHILKWLRLLHDDGWSLVSVMSSVIVVMSSVIVVMSSVIPVMAMSLKTSNSIMIIAFSANNRDHV